jgi:zinc protease
VCLAVFATPAAGQSGSAQVTEFEVAGIPVIYKPIEANEVVAVRLYLKGGSAAHTPALAGIENFIANVSQRGTEKYDRDAFAALSAATGTAIGAEANADFTAYFVQAVEEHWDEAWDLFAQAVRYPTFPTEEVELVRGQLINQLQGRQDNPDAHLAVLANNLLYEEHPYAIDPLGTVTSVTAITPDDMRRWHRERLTRENIVIVVVGGVPRDDLERKVAAAFADLPATGGAPREVPRITSSEPRVQVTERELPTNYIRGQFPAPNPAHANFAAMRIAIEILSDRLFEEVRTKRNLTYAVQAGLSQRSGNYGLLYVTAVDPGTTLPVMFGEVDRLKNEPISAERLAQSVNVFLTQYWLGQETNMGQAQTLGTYEMVGGGWQNADTFGDRVRAVTPADIQRVAREYLENVQFAVIGDPADIDQALFTSY